MSSCRAASLIRVKELAEPRGGYRIGVDIGGTFTDAVLLSEATGETRIAKVPSTPADPSRGFLDAVDRILGLADAEPGDVSYLVHGTTVATNSLIEGKTPRTAFITTRGFRDLLEIGRQVRPSLYDVHFEKPAPLVPRNLCFEVRERLDARGNELEPLDEAKVRAIAERLVREEVVSVAVCLLPRLAQSGAREAGRGDPADPRPGSGHLPVVRGLPRVSRVLPREHDDHQRLRSSRARPLHREHRGTFAAPERVRGAPHHAVERRRADIRDGCGEAGLHGRVRPRGRGHRVQPHRRGARAPERDLLRHGGNDRESRPHPRRPAQHHQGVRGRRAGRARHRPGPRERVPDPDPGHRSGRDRGGRRQHRLGRFGGDSPGRTRERGRGPGAHLLREGRRGADHHGCEPGARAPQPGVLPRRGDGPSCGGGARGHRSPLRRADGDGRGRLRERDRRDRERGDDERPSGHDRPAGLRPTGHGHGRVRGRGTAPREPALRRDEHRAPRRAPEPRDRIGLGPPRDRLEARVLAHPDHGRGKGELGRNQPDIRSNGGGGASRPPP